MILTFFKTKWQIKLLSCQPCDRKAGHVQNREFLLHFMLLINTIRIKLQVSKWKSVIGRGRCEAEE